VDHVRRQPKEKGGTGSLVVAGLDLARRRDHSALVILDVEPHARRCHDLVAG
jgi:hypothetical protein